MLVRAPARAAAAPATRGRAAPLAPAAALRRRQRAATATRATATKQEEQRPAAGAAAAAAAAAPDEEHAPKKRDDSWFSALLRFGGGGGPDDDDDGGGPEAGGAPAKPPKWASFSVARDVPAGALEGLSSDYRAPDPAAVAKARGRLGALALPWRRFAEGSFLAFKMEGAIPDALQGGAAPWPSAGAPSVPQIAEALEKAAYDPRVAGLAVEIGPLAVGWARLREIKRYVELFRASGKPCVAFIKLGGEKEYLLAASFAEVFVPPSATVRLNGFAVSGTFLRGALDKVGIDPQVRRIGAYKSAGDQLDRRDMSEAQREALNALVDGVYGGFCEEVARGRNGARDARAATALYAPFVAPPPPPAPVFKVGAVGAPAAPAAAAAALAAAPAAAPAAAAADKTADDVRRVLDEGVFEAERLLEGGWVDGLLYEDELIDLLKRRSAAAVERLSGPGAAAAARKRAKKAAKAGLDALPRVGLRKYSRVGRGALSFALRPNSGGSKKRPRISVLRAEGAITQGGSGGITPASLIPKLRALARDPATAAVVLRVDSPGGDALASDLMWREVRKLATKKPVIASMGDVAASGGYYIPMAATAIVAERLTVTGSIGVITAKPQLAGVYARTGVTKEIVSRGRYAQLIAADNRPFSGDERALFDRGAERAYAEFRDKAAASRGMTPAEMERWAQGRVWLGEAALERGLVDMLGGVGEAVRLAEIAAGLYEGEAEVEGAEGGAKGDAKKKNEGKRKPTPVVEVTVVRPSALSLLNGGSGGGASSSSSAARGALALASLAAAALGGGAGGALGLMMMVGAAAAAATTAGGGAGGGAVSAAASLLASSSLGAAAATGAPVAMLDAGAGGSEVSAVGSDMAMAQMRAGGLDGLALLGLGGGGAAVSDCDAAFDEGGSGGFNGGAAALFSGAALSIDEALGALVAEMRL